MTRRAQAGTWGLFLSLSASTWVCSVWENPSGRLHTSHSSASLCVWYIPPDSKEICIKRCTKYLFNLATVEWPALPMEKPLWSHFADQPDETEGRPHTSLGVDLTKGWRSCGDSSSFSSFIIVTSRWWGGLVEVKSLDWGQRSGTQSADYFCLQSVKMVFPQEISNELLRDGSN